MSNVTKPAYGSRNGKPVLAVLLAVVALGGCDTFLTSGEAIKQKASGVRYFAAERSVLIDTLRARENAACQSASGDPAALQACVREVELKLFDTTGNARTYCATVADPSAFLSCVVDGTTIDQGWRRSAKYTAAPRPEDWRNPDGGRRKLLDELKFRSMFEMCPELHKTVTCFRRESAELLGVPTEMAEQCRGDAIDGNSVSLLGLCIIDAASVVSMRNRL